MNDGLRLYDVYRLTRPQDGRSRRASSYDRSGGNKDFIVVHPGERRELCDIAGPGTIRHIWMTMAPTGADEAFLPRKVVLRMHWDGERNPSVQAPIGDFFGLGHGVTRNYSSACLAMSPEDGRALNCFFPMPFAERASVEIESEAEAPIKFYFYIDYLEDTIPEDSLRFHAEWRRARPEGATSGMTNEQFQFGGKNRSGDANYEVLNATGRGHYVGCNFNVHNLRITDEWNWYGEGDDMIFVDGEQWPPSLHGTGTEDYFNTAWCPQQEVQTPYHGIILGGGPNWSGKISVYRYHILDPVVFHKSIRVTIEHGHNNHRSDDISSTAYWYQSEPHRDLSPIPAVGGRLPLPDIQPINPKRAEEALG